MQVGLYGGEAYLNRILRAEAKLQPIRLALVYWVRVDNTNIHEPCLEVFSLYKCYARRELVVHLFEPISEMFVKGVSEEQDAETCVEIQRKDGSRYLLQLLHRYISSKVLYLCFATRSSRAFVHTLANRFDANMSTKMEILVHADLKTGGNMRRI